jgi:hypothetical protein
MLYQSIPSILNLEDFLKLTLQAIHFIITTLHLRVTLHRVKVKAHSELQLNEEADMLAKWELYHQTLS